MLHASSADHDLLLGRDRVLSEAMRCLEQHRWVTVSGCIGLGKTRLIRMLVQELRGAGKRIVHGSEHDPTPCQPWLEGLEPIPDVLVMDGCVWTPSLVDHVRSAVETLPALKVLVGSRGPARDPAEHHLALGPLECDAEGEAVSLLSRITGFEVASLNRERREQLARLCANLEGSPLGIVRLGGVVRRLPPSDWDEVLRRGQWRSWTPDDHTPSIQTMLEAALEGLENPVRQLLTMLSFAPVGIAMDEAVALARHVVPDQPLSALLSLTDAGLLESRHGRYRVPSLVRFSSSSREPQLITWYAQTYLRALRQRSAWSKAPTLGGVDRPEPIFAQWLREESPNLEAVLDHLLESRDPQRAIPVALALALEAFDRGQLVASLQCLAPLANESLPPQTQLSILEVQYAVHETRRDSNAAALCLERMLSLVRFGGRPDLQVPIQQRLALHYQRLERFIRARGVLAELGAAARRLCDEHLRHTVTLQLADIDLLQRDLDAARGKLLEVLDFARRSHHAQMSARAWLGLLTVALERGEDGRVEALELLRVPGDDTQIQTLRLIALARVAHHLAPRLSLSLALIAKRRAELPEHRLEARHASSLNALLETLEATLGASVSRSVAAKRSDVSRLEARLRRLLSRDEVAINLTSTEAELAMFVASGRTNREIARTLGRSEFTVRNQLVKLYAKLNCRNRADLARFVAARASMGQLLEGLSD
jgi:DNA-binding NarL/FixJ family response regulator